MNSGFVIDDPTGALGDHSGDDCDGCSVSATVHVPQVILTLSTNTMTLKHDNQCVLNVVTKPAALEFTDHRIRIRPTFVEDSLTFSLASGTNYSWSAICAGRFQLHADAKLRGSRINSTNQLVTIRFPTRAEILSDEVIASAMETAWIETLADCTVTQYRERGFMISLDTSTDTYSSDASGYLASTNTPGEEAEGTFFFEPENAEEITPLSSGVEYWVAFFHTHPPYTFAPAGQERNTGPSPTDARAAERSGFPGLLLDYMDPDLEAGHDEEDPTWLFKYGEERRDWYPHEE